MHLLGVYTMPLYLYKLLKSKQTDADHIKKDLNIEVVVKTGGGVLH